MNTKIAKRMKALGFSLIELMVVIAIVALLAAIAVPAYSSYMAKSRGTEVSAFIGEAMSSFSQKHASGEVPSDTGALGDYIAGIAFSSTGFAVTMVDSSALNDAYDATQVVVTYVADTDNANGIIAWTCTVGPGGVTSGDKAIIIANNFTRPVTCT